MKLSTVDTWLPVFSGFYGTIWETERQEEQEIENINEARREKGLPAIDYDAVEWDYKGYQMDVVRAVTAVIGQRLVQLGMVKGFKFQELKSPREYYFANDSINVQFTFAAANIKRIAAYLKEHRAEFAEYIKERYTSRDGFSSFHSNDSSAWTGDYLGETMAHGHRAGAVLQFVLLNEEGQDYEMSIYEDASSNGAYLMAANYADLVAR